MDAPSPTGSESPFQGMGGEESQSPNAESEKSATPEPATDNRDVEDMDLSDVEDDGSKIIGTPCVISRPLAPCLFCFPHQ